MMLGNNQKFAPRCVGSTHSARVIRKEASTRETLSLNATLNFQRKCCREIWSDPFVSHLPNTPNLKGNVGLGRLDPFCGVPDIPQFKKSYPKAILTSRGSNRPLLTSSCFPLLRRIFIRIDRWDIQLSQRTMLYSIRSSNDS